MRLVLLSVILLVSSVLKAESVLPPEFKLPFQPVPGRSGCASCSSKDSEGNEIPYFDNMAVPLMKFSLLEEGGSGNLADALLTVSPGSSAVFSPESRYLLTPPEEEQKKDSKKTLPEFKVQLWQVPLRFPVVFDKMGNSNLYSTTLPGYSLVREGQYFLVTDHSSGKEFRFLSMDGGQTWKIDSIQYRGNPSSRVSCKYNRDNMVTEIHIPGNRRYLLDYKFGQPVKVTSPSGAITALQWNEAGSLKRILTVLTDKHPLYIRSSKGKSDSLPVVRDLYFSCSPTGDLQEVTNTTGEHYSVKVLTSRQSGISERTAIITYPDGIRKFCRNTMGGVWGKLVTEGVVLDTKNGDKFVVLKERPFTHKNGFWVERSASGVTNEYRGGNLAPTASVDAYGNRTTYTNNVCGLRTSTTYPDKSRTEITYDAKWNKIKAVDECGRVKTWTYNPDGILVQYQYGDMVTKYEYGEEKRPVKSILPGNLVHQFAWDEYSRMTSHTRPDGASTEYVYFGMLDKLKEMSHVSADKQKRYTLTYQYDTQGRLARIFYPDDTWEGFAYDCCNMTDQRSRSGAVRKYVFNQQKQKVRDISPSGEVTSYEYDPTGNLVKIVYPNKTFTAYTYTQEGKLVKMEGSNRLAETFERDKMDRQVAVKRADGVESRRTYDSRGRMKAITGELERNISYSFDQSGNVIESMDWGLPKETTPRKASYVYDSMNRRIKAVRDGREEVMTYLSGTPFLVSMVSGDLCRYMQYDAFGRQISSSTVSKTELDRIPSPAEREKWILDHRKEFKSYDSFGNLSRITDGKGNLLTQYTFAPDGQLETILHPTSDSSANLQTYRHYYSQKGEQIFEIFQKTIAWGTRK